MFKQLKVALAAVVVGAVASMPSSVQAQITVPNTLQAGAVIRAAELNTNFSTLGDKALNRITGGTLEGNLVVSENVTIDGVDLSDFLLSTGEVVAQTGGAADGPAFASTEDTTTGLYFPDAGQIAFTLAGTQRMLLGASGLWVYGNNIINSDGKIPAITSTYFASLAGGNLTSLNASALSNGTVPDARLSANVPLLDAASLSFTGDISIGGTLAVTGAATLDDVTAADVAVGTLRVGTSATEGYVLTADSDGNATWQSPGVVTGVVPSGMIAIFDTACPAGWTHVSAFNNKFLRGGSTYDAEGGGQDTHSHTASFFPGETVWSTNAGGGHTHTISSDGAHTHTADVGSTTTSSSGSHTHGVSGSTSNAGSHSHTGSTTTNGSHSHSVSSGGTTVQAGSGANAIDFVGNTDSGGSHNHSFTTSSDGSHSHSFSVTSGSGGAHTHTVDPTAVTTSSAGSHTHTAEAVAAHTHGIQFPEMPTDEASNVPAYVQVVFCKKN